MAELDQVVYEYGKLHLNFVACQRQNALLATQLAQANKRIAELEKGNASQTTAGQTPAPKLVPDEPADAGN